MLKFVCFQLFFVSSIILPKTVGAEELLIKGEAKYIGWQTSKLKFTTCHQDDIEIGDGKIEKTMEKCQKPPDGPGPLVTAGVVKDVNINDETFQIADEKGRSYRFFLPKGANVRLEDIKIGERISVISPIKGRAETIEFGVRGSIKTDSTLIPHAIEPKEKPGATPETPVPKSN